MHFFLINMRRVLAGWVTAVGCLAFGAVDAQATVIFKAAEGNLAASAEFSITGSQLQIVLTNTSLTPPTHQDDVLTGVFFVLPDGVTLTPVSATAEDVIQESGADPNGPGTADVSGSDVNVGGEFQYASGDWSWHHTLNHGIASARYIDPDGSARGNFNGDSLNKGPGIGGTDFGIVPDGYVEGSGVGNLDSKPLIQDSVTFLLDISGLLPLDGITGVHFTFGGGSVPAKVIAEPVTAALLAVGSAVVVAARRRRR